MKTEYEDFLKNILDSEGHGTVPMSRLSKGLLRKTVALAEKCAQQNPLENSMWENLIDGALVGLEVVAIGSLDWKLTAIVKLLQSWIKDRREEKARQKQETEYGAGNTIDHNYTQNYNYGDQTYY